VFKLFEQDWNSFTLFKKEAKPNRQTYFKELKLCWLLLFYLANQLIKQTLLFCIDFLFSYLIICWFIKLKKDKKTLNNEIYASSINRYLFKKLEYFLTCIFYSAAVCAFCVCQVCEFYFSLCLFKLFSTFACFKMPAHKLSSFFSGLVLTNILNKKYQQQPKSFIHAVIRLFILYRFEFLITWINKEKIEQETTTKNNEIKIKRTYSKVFSQALFLNSISTHFIYLSKFRFKFFLHIKI